MGALGRLRYRYVAKTRCCGGVAAPSVPAAALNLLERWHDHIGLLRPSLCRASHLLKGQSSMHQVCTYCTLLRRTVM